MNAIHPNSQAAYHEEKDAGHFNQREMMILAALRRVGSATDRALMELLGFTEPNQVRPRVNHLLEMGAILHDGDTRCPVTGKTVRLVRHAHREFQLSLLP